MGSNFIDVTESLATKLELSYSRIDDDEISIDLVGEKSTYELTVMLRQDYEIIYFSCDLDLRAGKEKHASIANAIVRANERIWVGHFDLLSASNCVAYTFTVPFMYSFLADELVVESIIDLITVECDRFYHYFLMILENEWPPDTDFSLDALFLEAVGEA